MFLPGSFLFPSAPPRPAQRCFRLARPVMFSVQTAPKRDPGVRTRCDFARAAKYFPRDLIRGVQAWTCRRFSLLDVGSYWK